jgi:uncharacterized membrane protein YhaH (DUF805 family)
MRWFIACLRRYWEFSGRAGRPEFWIFFLVYLVGAIATGLIDYQLNSYMFSTVWSAALLIPYISVGARRMHDVGFSGWWLLVALIPFCVFGVLIALALPGKPAANKYGYGPRLLTNERSVAYP